MTALQTFWTWILGTSVVLFCAVELIIVIGGARDIGAMLRDLRDHGQSVPEGTEADENA